jgi:predicted dinucleotide-binding enzyme
MGLLSHSVQSLKGKGEVMNIGVIGTGDIGDVIIRKSRDAGYPVKMANSRGPESLSTKRSRSENGSNTCLR